MFAILHGHSHGTEMPQAAAPLLYSLGFILSTATLHAAGIAIGLARHIPRLLFASRAIRCKHPLSAAVRQLSSARGLPSTPRAGVRASGFGACR
ncbi:HupE/UreJ family protein [Azospirillum thiophilum]|uniref:HupE/UreJ family protein n=1 Tax=Azospirillum thiophilum TaxID=528244 RepID=UPI001FE1B606|nr:HupE/UreJ family protein [Azospirillum thiophilum]